MKEFVARDNAFRSTSAVRKRQQQKTMPPSLRVQPSFVSRLFWLRKARVCRRRFERRSVERVVAAQHSVAAVAAGVKQPREYRCHPGTLPGFAQKPPITRLAHASDCYELW